jgi:ADP-ribosylglycohydrolase
MDPERRPPYDRDGRIKGIVLGAAIGDALGWPQEQRSGIQGGKAARSIPARPEFREWSRYSGTRFSRYQESVFAGEYSDDTQLLLAVTRSCLTPDWRGYFSRVELPAWPVYQRGGGLAVLRASRAWVLSERPPWSLGEGSNLTRDFLKKYFAGGANGVAMRIAPHVAVTVTEDSTDSLLERVLKDGICTHGHPRALIGGMVHALALRYMLRLQGPMGYDDLPEFLLSERSWQRVDLLDTLPSEWLNAYRITLNESPVVLWRSVVDETITLLEIVLRSLERGAMAHDHSTFAELGCFDRRTNGAGHVSATAAIYAASRMAARPMSALLYTAYLQDADTDTLASMTASLLGAVHGADWLNPMAAQVQDIGYLTAIADELSNAARSEGEMLVHSQPPPVSKGKIVTFLDELAEQVVGSYGSFLDQRRYSLESKQELQSVSSSHKVFRWRLQLADGQTMVIDRVRRINLPSIGLSVSRDDATSTINRSTSVEASRSNDPYDVARYSTGDEVRAALQLASREIELRQRFHELFLVASTAPQAAIGFCRKEIEVLLSELAGQGRGVVSESGQEELFPATQLDLSRARLSPSMIEVARQIWRHGSVNVHRRAADVSDAIEYIHWAEAFAIDALREGWPPTGR